LQHYSFVEKVNKELDPLRMNVSKAAQAIYLLKGDLGLRYIDDNQAYYVAEPMPLNILCIPSR